MSDRETPKARVVVLDDEPLIGRAAARVLQRIGLDVTTTTDPNEARSIILAEHPAVVVSDLHMPAVCGAEFLEEIAAKAPDTLRVLCSADPNFRPTKGTIAGAQLHALVAKTHLKDLAGLIRAQLEARSAEAIDDEAALALAADLAAALARPGHEDPAHRARLDERTGMLAAAIGADDRVTVDARLGAILHDVGQVTLPEHVFARVGRLTPDDRNELRGHPTGSARIISAIPALRRAAPIVAAHHERSDGTGYPDGLAGDAIPMAARIFQVIDAYDAMTEGRHYAKRRTHRQAVDELVAEAGRQHDPMIVRAFADLEEAALSKRPGQLL